MSSVTKKPVMAEMLVRHIFGEAETFEHLCEQRGVSVEEAVSQALRNWVGPGQQLQTTAPVAVTTSFGFVPDPADCPSGHESHWIGLCEHDLTLLRREQQRLFAAQDKKGLTELTRTIESYIQTLASLRERLVA